MIGYITASEMTNSVYLFLVQVWQALCRCDSITPCALHVYFSLLVETLFCIHAHTTWNCRVLMPVVTLTKGDRRQKGESLPFQCLGRLFKKHFLVSQMALSIKFWCSAVQWPQWVGHHLSMSNWTEPNPFWWLTWQCIFIWFYLLLYSFTLHLSSTS